MDTSPIFTAVVRDLQLDPDLLIASAGAEAPTDQDDSQTLR